MVEAGVTRLVTALRRRSDDERLPYYGIEVPPSLIAGIYLTELLVHGVDLARTHHRPLDVPDRAAYSALLASCTLTSLRAHPVGSHLFDGARLGCTRPSAHRHRARQAARSGSPTAATEASTPGSVVRPRTSSSRATDDSARSPRSGPCGCVGGAPTAAS